MNFIQTLLTTILGSGIAVGLLERYWHWRDKKEDRQIQTARDKLEKLYAPLFFFTSQNTECFQQCDIINKSLSSDAVNTKDGQGNRVCLLGSEGMNQTLNMQNAYVAVVKQNNEQIFNILRANWMYIDSEDIDLFRQVIFDHVRLKTEVAADGKRKLPFLIVHEMENIYFMRPDFAERVKKRFTEKQSFLETLSVK